MTSKFAKRHYETIAQVMQDTCPARVTGNESSHIYARWQIICMALAEAFKADNGAFSRDRFERACQPGANVRART